MAVALTTPPAPYSFSKNHIEIGFTSNNYLDQVGVAAVGDLGIANAIPAGTVISFKYGSTVVNMTAAAAPDNSGNQFPSGTVYNQAYIDSLLPYFKANHLLSRDFDIVPAGTSYRFNAKKKSNGFDLVPVTGPGFLITLVTPGQPEKVKPGFSIYFELYAQNDDHSAYEKVIATNIPLKPGAGGIATVDIASYLHSFFETAVDKIPVDFPDPASPAALLCTKSCRKYYFRYAEMWSNQVQKVSESAKYTVLYGGLSYTGAFKFTLSSLFVPSAGDPSKDRFLKQGNAQIYTRTNQPQYLYFFNTRATANGAKLKAKYYFTDGSAALTETKSTFNLEQYRKYGFNTRFDVLYSGAKTVERYEIWLESSTGAKLSEIRTYWLNYELREFVRYFINNSSWGGLDSLLCYGKGNSEFERSQQTANRIRRAGQDIKTGDRTVFDIKINEQFEVATGWMSKTDLANSRDFFLSKFTYRYVGGLTLPIEISSKNIPETEDGVNRYARLFEYRYLFDDHSYTEGDVEDPGTGFDGFFFHNSNPVNPTGGIQEVDPTVPSWVKSITVADIQRWNSGSTVIGEHLHELADITGLQAALDGKAPSTHGHGIGDISGLQDVLDGKLSGSANDWVKNQSALQEGSQLHVSKARVADELYIPASGLISGQKARIKFALSAGSGGEAPPPPLTSVSFSQITGTWSENTLLAEAINGKAALSHTHPISAITDLQTILNGKAASSHTHTIANISGLQDALDGKVSGTADNFIKNQSAIQSDAQFHVAKARVATELYIPATGLSSGQKARIKFALSAGSGGEAPPPPLTSVSFSQITGTWSDNTLLAEAINGKAALSHTHPVSAITDLETILNGKAASSHTHTIANISGLQDALDGKVSGTADDYIKNQSALQSGAQIHVEKVRAATELYIPATGLTSGQKARIKFANNAGSGGEAPPPPLTSVGFSQITGVWSDNLSLKGAIDGKASLSHTHSISDTTGLQTALDGKAASSHTHAIANITGLQTALDAKAASSHTHAIANVTGLQTALDAKVTGSANDWVKNQSALQAGSQFHVSKARVADEFYIPATGLSSGQKARIKFALSAGSGGEAPPPPLTSVAWGDITGSLSAQTDLMTVLNGYFAKQQNVDLDTRKTSGWVSVVGGHASNPWAGTGSSGFSSFESTNYGWQLIGSDGGSFNLKGRILNNGVWGAWVSLFHSGNFDPATKLDKSAKAADSTKWNGYTNNFAAGASGAGIVSMVGVDAGDTAYRFTQAAVRTFLGLGNAAYSSTADFFGNERIMALSTTGADANSVHPNGGFHFSYSTNSWLANSAFNEYGGLITYKAPGTSNRGALQIQYGLGHSSEANSRIAFRTEYGTTGGNWRAWKELWHTGNFTPSNYALLSGAAFTGAISGTSANFSTEVSVSNPANASAVVYFGWLNNRPRLRIGGTGTGADGSFEITGAADFVRMSLNSAGSVTFPGSVTASSASFTGSGNNLVSITQQAVALSNNTYTLYVNSSSHASNLLSAGAFAVDALNGRAFTINGWGNTILGGSLTGSVVHLNNASNATSEGSGALYLNSTGATGSVRMILGADNANGIAFISAMKQSTTWAGILNLQPNGGSTTVGGALNIVGALTGVENIGVNAGYGKGFTLNDGFSITRETSGTVFKFGSAEKMRMYAAGMTATGTVTFDVGAVWDLKIGKRNTWGAGGTYYQTIYGSNTAREEYIMLHMPHVPFLVGGTAGVGGSGTLGALIRFAGQAGATSRWDIGCKTADVFTIDRTDVVALQINSAAQVSAPVSLDSPILRASNALYIPSSGLAAGQKVRIKFKTA